MKDKELVEKFDKAIESEDYFDIEEIHYPCVVQILTNSRTGEVSVGWYKADNPPNANLKSGILN